MSNSNQTHYTDTPTITNRPTNQTNSCVRFYINPNHQPTNHDQPSPTNQTIQPPQLRSVTWSHRCSTHRKARRNDPPAPARLTAMLRCQGCVAWIPHNQLSKKRSKATQKMLDDQPTIPNGEKKKCLKPPTIFSTIFWVTQMQTGGNYVKCDL